MPSRIMSEVAGIAVTWQLTHLLKLRQIEIKGNVGALGTPVLIVVGLDGYDHKWYRRDGGHGVGMTGRGDNTLDRNVHIAMAGPLSMSFAEYSTVMNDVFTVVAAARKTLEETEKARF